VRRSYDFDWFKVKWRPHYGWIFDRTPAVVVIAIAPDDRMWLERIERPATGTTSWEMPGGGVDPDEDVVAAGLRELEEECGLVATAGARVLGGRLEPVPGMGTIPHYIVTAFGVVPKGRRAVQQKAEGILAVRQFDRAAICKMVRSGRINVLATLGALTASGWLQGEALPKGGRRKGVKVKSP
jgi:8-oxo-dGDP phosphatase